MKKENAINFLIISIILISIIPAIHADVASDTKDKIDNTVGNIQSPDQIAQEKSDYLKGQWKVLLTQNSFFGPIIRGLDSLFGFFNPFFKAILGVEYSLSWGFVFALLIWTILFLFIYPPARALFNNQWFAIIGTFVIVSLVGISGVIKKAVDILSTMITNTWIAWLSLAITIIVGLIITKFGKNLKKIIEREREKSDKTQLRQDRDIIHTDAEVSKKKYESYREGSD
ncbi:hypothetical protein KW787_02450 [Candidatus Pacearchaeota archaeon]|nr:hypothetical protein [Candidatus Pacearchaeota archaeon]